MKKGCFIKSVIFITILVGIVVYIVQYKLEDWLIEPGEKMFIQKIAENWNLESTFIKDSKEKDSLRVLVNYYANRIKNMEEVVNLENNLFLNELEDIIEDSLVTENELSNLTQILQKEENEKSTINRD
jgi:hypothetical protein